MKYLSVTNNENFGFKIDTIHQILETDIAISEESYEKFFSVQREGKQLRILNVYGTTFEEIFEEYIPEPVVMPKSELELLRERLALTEAAINDLLLGGI